MKTYELPVKKFTLEERENDVIELCLNGSACQCPFAGQQMLPVPGKIHGTMELAQYSRNCNSVCQFFSYGMREPLTIDGDVYDTQVGLMCTNGTRFTTRFVPFKKKSNLTIH